MISIDVIGDIFLDIYIIQEQGEDIHKSEIYMFPGGSRLIIAIGLAKRGYNVRLIGNVGNDFVGDYLIKILTRYGVDVDYVQRMDMRTPLFVNINEKLIAIDRQLLDCDVLLPNNKSDYLFITTEISEEVINRDLFSYYKKVFFDIGPRSKIISNNHKKYNNVLYIGNEKECKELPFTCDVIKLGVNHPPPIEVGACRNTSSVD
jgi:sugar/nucleoside kinase (ribokinase family)